MKCPCCQTASQDLYCASCLNQGLENHAQAHHILKTQLSASRSRSEKILYGNPTPSHSGLSHTLSPPSSRFVTSSGFSPRSPAVPGLWAERAIRAQIHRLKQVNEELVAEITQSRVRRAELRKEVDEKRKQLGKRRANLDGLRDGAKQEFPSSPSFYYQENTTPSRSREPGSPDPLSVRLAEQRDENAQTRSALRRARKVLVPELVSVYGVRPRKFAGLDHGEGNMAQEGGGGRTKASGSKVAKRGADEDEMEMEIAGLWLPTPKHFTGHSSNHLNGTISHLLHLLHLISIYLDIKIPFGWSYGGSEIDSHAALKSPSEQSMATSMVLSPISTITPSPAPIQRAGFQVYPQPIPGSSGSGWQVGKPVVSVGDSLGFGTSVKLSAERELTRRDKQVFEEHDDEEENEGEPDEALGETRDDDDDLKWVRTEDLSAWRKKSIFYVSTSRERWKRRSMQSHAMHAAPSTAAQHDLPPPPGDPNPDSRKKDKYRLKEEAMILGYAMICYDVACIGWMNGVDLHAPAYGAGDEEVYWSKVLNPLRIIWELVHSEDLGRLSHTPSISVRSGSTSPNDEDVTTIDYIPLPFSFVTLVRKATEAFDDHDDKGLGGNTRNTDHDSAGLGVDDWDLL